MHPHMELEPSCDHEQVTCTWKPSHGHSQVKSIPWVKTDGAAAYSGPDFTFGLTTLPVPVLAHYIGEAGTNKSPQDGHFGVLGQALDRLVASGKHDLNAESALYEGIGSVDLQHTTAMLFTPDRSFNVKLAAIPDLIKMSQRVFEWDATRKVCTGLRLHQQSFMGKGRCVPMADILVDTEHKALPIPHLRRSTGVGARCWYY